MINNFHRFTGKVAIVVGSSTGIGYSVARRLAIEGAKVIIASRRKENVDAATDKLKSEGLEVTGIVCHASNMNERATLLKEAERLGGLDIIMMNAGVNPSPTHILDTPETAWDKCFDVNVKSSYLMCKEALPLLKNSRSGRIIFMSSLAAFFPSESLAVYSISKLALLGLTKFTAMQLAPYKITVNCLVPGPIDTKFSKMLFDTEKGKNFVLSNIPMKRFGTPEEVSNLAAFLASDEASYISGENIVIGGAAPSRI